MSNLLQKNTSSSREEKPAREGLRIKLYEVIFEADTPAGKAFDILLLLFIVLSVIAVMLESVASVRADYGFILLPAEWAFTVLFTIEYLLRLISVRKPAHYAWSFFGVIDLLAILPTYMSIFIAGSQSLLVIRVLRLLRVFRIFKLSRYVGAATLLKTALDASKQKIVVFLFVILTAVVIMGTLVYLIEGADGGFTSIPTGIYWAIVTMTTVGYGDLAPQTVPGQILASIMMILGYGIIAVPPGIVTVELAEASRQAYKRSKHGADKLTCDECGHYEHDSDAIYCKKCGRKMIADL